MTDKQAQVDVAEIRRHVVGRLLDRKTVKILLRCPDDVVLNSVLDLAVAELEAMRDPALRALAAERGRAH